MLLFHLIKHLQRLSEDVLLITFIIMITFLSLLIHGVGESKSFMHLHIYILNRYINPVFGHAHFQSSGRL